jgi:hypothetical protein
MDPETAAQRSISALTAAVDHLTAAFDKLAKVQPPSFFVREAQMEIDLALDGIDQAAKACRDLLAELKP